MTEQAITMQSPTLETSTTGKYKGKQKCKNQKYVITEWEAEKIRQPGIKANTFGGPGS